jgi:hypothetical protein
MVGVRGIDAKVDCIAPKHPPCFIEVVYCLGQLAILLSQCQMLCFSFSLDPVTRYGVVFDIKWHAV